ncbi:hypothetical protein A3J33_04385 [candidate division WWE3 bacterium RIFCSPLOWO2_02_FULL_53_10]|uniref:Adenylate kinase n=2 Tax=Katanobacteria TaxID=422282 RepID=A0A1F4WM54_UNCKA|nr:MAG: hypothetical protein A2890_02605 [candidate division WWE3 bacterium RIFCSPLOWO2_01_FULL_53_14]OGC70469.1 MAG: hypothetical protein A3J33_04385 [candidate division WWE3 bacterium RIFCSPLOWO2_02_FULL_53_10]
MDQNPHVGAILLMGPPGAGKGTQAFRLAEQFPNFVHFDTGGEIYRRVTDPHFVDDPLVQEQKEIYFGGKLNTPEWVAGLVAERIRFYSGKGQGVIFSGSPRTVYETQAVMPLLEEAYGKEQILVVALGVSLETITKRSRDRLVCRNNLCRYPAALADKGTPCPNCGKPLPAEQSEDEKWKWQGMETRFREYRERTLPAIDILRAGYQTIAVDAEMSEEEIFAKISLAAHEKFKL